MITTHGRPVARIVPADADDAVGSGFRDALLTRPSAHPGVEAGRRTRDDLHAEDD